MPILTSEQQALFGVQPPDLSMRDSAAGKFLGMQPHREDIIKMVRDAADEYGIEQNLLLGNFEQESGFNPKAKSPKGAYGVAQLMPDTAIRLGVKNQDDVQENIRAGAKYFSSLLKRYGGSPELALAAYNSGEGNVDKHGGIPPFKETRGHVQKSLARANKWGGNYAVPDFGEPLPPTFVQSIASKMKALKEGTDEFSGLVADIDLAPAPIKEEIYGKSQKNTIDEFLEGVKTFLGISEDEHKRSFANWFREGPFEPEEALKAAGHQLMEAEYYDYPAAIKSGVLPDETGHWGSIVPGGPDQGLILKDPQHPTFYKTLETEERLGNVIWRNKATDRLYSFEKGKDPGEGFEQITSVFEEDLRKAAMVMPEAMEEGMRKEPFAAPAAPYDQEAAEEALKVPGMIQAPEVEKPIEEWMGKFIYSEDLVTRNGVELNEEMARLAKERRHLTMNTIEVGIYNFFNEKLFGVPGVVNRAIGAEEPKPESVPAAVVGTLAGFAGFIKGYATSAAHGLIKETVTPQIGTLPAIAQLFIEQGMTLAAAFGMQNAVRNFYEASKPEGVDWKKFFNDVAKDTNTGFLMGIAFMIPGLVENKTVGMAIGLALTDMAKALPEGKISAAKELYDRIIAGDIDRLQLAELATGYLLEFYLISKVPRMKNEWIRSDPAKQFPFDILTADKNWIEEHFETLSRNIAEDMKADAESTWSEDGVKLTMGIDPREVAARYRTLVQAWKTLFGKKKREIGSDYSNIYPDEQTAGKAIDDFIRYSKANINDPAMLEQIKNQAVYYIPAGSPKPKDWEVGTVVKTRLVGALVENMSRYRDGIDQSIERLTEELTGVLVESGGRMKVRTMIGGKEKLVDYTSSWNKAYPEIYELPDNKRSSGKGYFCGKKFPQPRYESCRGCAAAGRGVTKVMVTLPKNMSPNTAEVKSFFDNLAPCTEVHFPGPAAGEVSKFDILKEKLGDQWKRVDFSWRAYEERKRALMSDSEKKLQRKTEKASDREHLYKPGEVETPFDRTQQTRDMEMEGAITPAEKRTYDMKSMQEARELQMLDMARDVDAIIRFTGRSSAETGVSAWAEMLQKTYGLPILEVPQTGKATGRVYDLPGEPRDYMSDRLEKAVRWIQDEPQGRDGIAEAGRESAEAVDISKVKAESLEFAEANGYKTGTKVVFTDPQSPLYGRRGVVELTEDSAVVKLLGTDVVNFLTPEWKIQKGTEYFFLTNAHYKTFVESLARKMRVYDPTLVDEPPLGIENISPVLKPYRHVEYMKPRDFNAYPGEEVYLKLVSPSGKVKTFYGRLTMLKGSYYVRLNEPYYGLRNVKWDRDWIPTGYVDGGEVINMKTWKGGKFFVNVDRTTGLLGEGGWGNPFKDPAVPKGERVRQYEELLRDLIADDFETWIPNLSRLAHRRLACWDVPEPCHAQVLASYAKCAFEIHQAALEKGLPIFKVAREYFERHGMRVPESKIEQVGPDPEVMKEIQEKKDQFKKEQEAELRKRRMEILRTAKDKAETEKLLKELEREERLDIAEDVDYSRAEWPDVLDATGEDPIITKSKEPLYDPDQVTVKTVGTVGEAPIGTPIKPWRTGQKPIRGFRSDKSFYAEGQTGKNDFWLSTFFSRQVEFRHHSFPSAEAAYRAAQDWTPENIERMKRMKAEDAFRIQPERLNRQEQMRVMFEILAYKFSHWQDLRNRLIMTGDAELIHENEWKQHFWGQSPTGEGKNVLGRMIMEIRRQLQEGAKEIRYPDRKAVAVDAPNEPIPLPEGGWTTDPQEAKLTPEERAIHNEEIGRRAEERREEQIEDTDAVDINEEMYLRMKELRGRDEKGRREEEEFIRTSKKEDNLLKNGISILESEGKWVIAHTESGKKILREFSSKENAIRFAEIVLQKVDFTKPVEEVMKDMREKNVLRETEREYAGDSGVAVYSFMGIPDWDTLKRAFWWRKSTPKRVTGEHSPNRGFEESLIKMAEDARKPTAGFQIATRKYATPPEKPDVRPTTLGETFREEWRPGSRYIEMAEHFAKTTPDRMGDPTFKEAMQRSNLMRGIPSLVRNEIEPVYRKVFGLSVDYDELHLINLVMSKSMAQAMEAKYKKKYAQDMTGSEFDPFDIIKFKNDYVTKIDGVLSEMPEADRARIENKVRLLLNTYMGIFRDISHLVPEWQREIVYGNPLESVPGNRGYAPLVLRRMMTEDFSSYSKANADILNLTKDVKFMLTNPHLELVAIATWAKEKIARTKINMDLYEYAETLPTIGDVPILIQDKKVTLGPRVYDPGQLAPAKYAIRKNKDGTYTSNDLTYRQIFIPGREKIELPGGGEKYGEQKSFFMLEPYATMLENRPPWMNEPMLKFFGWISGSKLFKMGTVGLNPKFFLFNFPKDIAFTIQRSPEYPEYVLGTGMLMYDMARVFKDVLLKKGVYEDYIKEGGGTDFISTSSRVGSEFGWFRRFQDMTGFFNETFELLPRIALRQRVLDNLMKTKVARGEMTEEQARLEATWRGRNIIDFSIGGKWSRLADEFIPFFTASLRSAQAGLDTLLKGTKQEKIQGWAKAGEIVALSAWLTIWNLKQDQEKYLGINPWVYRNYWNFPTGLYEVKADAVKESQLYIKFPADHFARPFKAIGDVIGRAIYGVPVTSSHVLNTVWDNLRFIPFADTTFLPPILKGVLGYAFNVDTDFDRPLWADRQFPVGSIQAWSEYRKGIDSPVAITAAEKLYGWTGGTVDLSPRRLGKSFGKVVPTYNFWVDLMEGGVRELEYQLRWSATDKMLMRHGKDPSKGYDIATEKLVPDTMWGGFKNFANWALIKPLTTKSSYKNFQEAVQGETEKEMNTKILLEHRQFTAILDQLRPFLYSDNIAAKNEATQKAIDLVMEKMPYFKAANAVKVVQEWSIYGAAPMSQEFMALKNASPDKKAISLASVFMFGSEDARRAAKWWATNSTIFWSPAVIEYLKEFTDNPNFLNEFTFGPKFASYNFADNRTRKEREEIPMVRPIFDPNYGKAVSLDNSYWIDGDTVAADINGKREKIRLIGIDTPETQKTVEIHGKEASDYVKSLVEGKNLMVHVEADFRDKHGRLLGYVFLPDKSMLNYHLVKEGYAVAGKNKTFLEAEKEARENKRGIWRFTQ